MAGTGSETTVTRFGYSIAFSYEYYFARVLVNRTEFTVDGAREGKTNGA